MAVHPVPLATFPDYQARTIPAAARLFSSVAGAERVLAAIILLAASPVLLLCSAVIAMLSGLSPLIAHRRVGMYGRTIWVLKLRTMWNNTTLRRARLIERLYSDAPPAAIPKCAADPRVTNSFAAFCRKHSLDELPQLWNVLRGEMALVGPRPLTREEIEVHYAADISELLRGRPGITGLWQVRGRSRLTYRQRRRLDLFLLRKCNFGMYCYVLWASVISVISGENAW